MSSGQAVVLCRRLCSPRSSSLAMLAIGVLICGLAICRSVRAADWPTYAHDVARSNVTAEKLALPLSQCWTHKPRFAPQPAWGDPKPDPVEGILELRRVHFDDTFHVAVAGDTAYFGSSADNKVYALDTATGRVRWSAITGGPVRLAPTVAGDRVLVGSDDGCVYSLAAADGSLAWRFRAAPEDRRVLGHGKMISLWPVRTGVLVDRGVAHFAAGIFPAEGIFFYAMDAASGKRLWCNDTCGETPMSTVSPQGYMLASDSTLYAPLGRMSPAALDRTDGRMLATPYFGKPIGGTYALLADNEVYTGTEQLIGYRGQTARGRFATFDARKIIVTADTTYVLTGSQLVALDRKEYPAASQKLHALRVKQESLQNTLSTVRLDRNTLSKELKEIEADLAQTDKPADRQQLQADLAAKQAKLASVQAAFDKQQAQSVDLAVQIKRSQAEVTGIFLWQVPCTCDQALILADRVLFAGGKDQVVALDTKSGGTLWTAAVEGSAKGLAAAAGRLFVSTDKGLIYCFGPEGSPAAAAIVETLPPRAEASASPWNRAAESILSQTGVRRGYCLVLGCENGGLAVALAQKSDLQIYAVASDAAKAKAVRAAVDAAGFYGARVCVDVWPLDKVPYSDYFANLVVSETAMTTGELPDAQEMFRMLKPLGGVALIGRFAGTAGRASSDTERPGILQYQLERWLVASGLQGRIVQRDGTWARIDRGPLAGAGTWTHQYADPGNTACGDDQRVKCPLGVLWFGHPGPGQMRSRHERCAAPLSMAGRLICEGDNCLMAFDAYNGLKLWHRDIEGAVRPNASHDGSNLALGEDHLFVAVADSCLRLDPATGETQATYRVPPGVPKARWGYVASANGLLYGSRSLVKSIQSDCVFAIDPKSRQQRWIFQSKRIPHNTIAIDGGRLFLVDDQVTPAQRQQVIDRKKQEVAELPEDQRPAALRALAKADVRRVVALDAKTGEILWQQAIDLTHCGGANLAVIAHNGAVVIFGVYLDGHYWRQFFGGLFASRRVTVLSAAEGKLLWSKAVGYRVRPVVIGDTIHTEPWAFDLHTGEPKTRVHPISGQTDVWQFARPGHHCGCPAASPNCLFFRSMTLGYYDLLGDFGTMHFGAQRPGCWINFIPAAGLLLVPEASAGCMCPFPNMCSVVFEPSKAAKGFGFYSAPGPTTPVRRLAIRFGATGDRNDAAGNLWLGYPRPGGSLVLPLKIGVTMTPGGAYQLRNSSYTPIAGTNEPWLFTSALRGIAKCTIPLLEPGDGASLYRVRLLMSDPDNDRAGRRVFDVRVQGKTVLRNCDIAGQSSGRDHALVKEFEGVEVSDNLVIEFVSKAKRPKPEQAPILQAVEVTRQRVVSLGCVVPEVMLNQQTPKQACEVRLANPRDDAFAGQLQIEAPAGIAITPRHTQINLAAGARTAVPIEIDIARSTPPGVTQVPVKLLRGDGSVELQRSMRVENLGRRTRIVLVPVADASVSQRYPELNKGTADTLAVDGGDQKMGDIDHSLAYLKFRLNLPGRPTSVRLRLYNAGNPSGDSGQICLVEGAWSESEVTYHNRPKVGPPLARVGSMTEHQMVEMSLPVDLTGKRELSLAIDPTSCDGVDFVSREGTKPPQLIIDCEPE